MKKTVVIFVILLTGLLSACAGAEFRHSARFEHRQFDGGKKVAIEVVFLDLEKNEILPIDCKGLETIPQFVGMSSIVKKEMERQLGQGGTIVVSQYPNAVWVIREELKKQLEAKGFNVVKEGVPDVFRLKIFGAQSGLANRFIGIIADGMLGQKAVISYDAGALYRISSSSQEEIIRDKIVPSLVRVVNDAFNSGLAKSL